MAARRTDRQQRHTIWRGRTRRLAVGLNVGVSLLLAALALGMVNYLARRYPVRWDISWRSYYRLSDKTKALLAQLRGTLNVTAFLGERSDLAEDIRALLNEYRYEAERTGRVRVRLEILDPNRDLVRTKALKERLEVDATNVVVFEFGGRTRHVREKDIIEFEHLVDYEELMAGRPAVERKRAAFRGEQAFSSAIQSVSQPTRPVVYFLTGHGERATTERVDPSGYSEVVRALRRDNMDVRDLLLSGDAGVPRDCAALVVGGPTKRFSAAELDLLAEFLSGGGRLCLLLDAGTETGLTELLSRWGVSLGEGVVVGLTFSGRELVVRDYPEHPITGRLRGVVTMFYLPRPILPASEEGSSQDRPSEDKARVHALAACAAQGWLERQPDVRPYRFDPTVDRRGPVPVAVAVEKGTVSGIQVGLKPTRMVVVGDSEFVSNAALRTGAAGNEDFFLSSLNWLVDREALMAVAPKRPAELRMGLDSRRVLRLYLLLTVVLPGAVGLMGLGVWLRRRS